MEFKERVKNELIENRGFDFDSEWWTDEELATYQETVQVCGIIHNESKAELLEQRNELVEVLECLVDSIDDPYNQFILGKDFDNAQELLTKIQNK